MANIGGYQTETPWQSGATTVSSMVESLLTKKEFCDVTFRVGADVQPNAEEFQCHRALLAGRSSVFVTMFYGSLPENKGVVEVKDILPTHFKLMLKFVYGDDTSGIDRDNLFAMYAVAHIYDIVPLKQFCAGLVKNYISMESIGDFLAMRDLYEDPVIAQHCDQFLKANAWKLFQNDEYFKDLSQKHLVEIWKRDVSCYSGNRLPETEIYWGAMMWAREECARRGLWSSPDNDREVLGDAMDLFCFPRMSLDEFNKFVKPDGVLTWEEIAEMVLYMVNVEDVAVPVGRPLLGRRTTPLASDRESVSLSDGRVVSVQRDLLQEAIAGKPPMCGCDCKANPPKQCQARKAKCLCDYLAAPQRRLESRESIQLPSVPHPGGSGYRGHAPLARENTGSSRGGIRPPPGRRFIPPWNKMWGGPR